MMKKIKALWQKVMIASLMVMASPAFAAVNRSTSGLNSIKTWLDTIVPIVAGMGIVVAGVAYSLGWIGKQAIQQWLIGLCIAGAGSWIVSLFF